MSLCVVREMFQSIPVSSAEKPSKGVLDHSEDYLGTSEGVRDLCDVVSHVFGTLELCTSPLSEMGRLATKVKDVFGTTGLALSYPQLISDVNRLRHSVSRLFLSSCVQTMQTARAVKDVAMSFLLLVNTGSRAVLFAQNSELLFLAARQVSRVNIIVSVTSFITDGSDLIRDCLEWQVEGKTAERDNLAFMNVMKNLSSVAASALLLISYAFGVSLTEPVMLGSMFVLGTVYLVSKISGYFYAKMVVEK